MRAVYSQRDCAIQAVARCNPKLITMPDFLLPLLARNWNLTLLLAISHVIILYAWLRAERKGRWLSVFFLVLPMWYLMYRLARWRLQLPELAISFGLGGGVYLLWHLLYLRKIPLPNSDNIQVWGQES
ncbi:MAG: hypothetical protein DWG81_01800 [Chloroflexi bacterium]|nr:hypothetical protein [Chloroflexota bacterium]